MVTMRVVFFPRETVPLAVHAEHGDGLEGASANHDLWRESDRFMRTGEFTQIMTRPRRWVRRAATWEHEEY